MDKQSIDSYPVTPGAVIVEGFAHNGKNCRIIDNTGTIARADLEQVLNELIVQRRFGVLVQIDGRSGAAGGAAGGHIQLNDTLYRLIVFPYQAIVEKF